VSKLNLKAYTILEITITMIISAIVISITYTAFGIVSGAYSQYKTDQEGLLELTQLDGLLRKDCAMAKRITNGADGMIFTGEDKRVVYVFSPSNVIRTSGIIDTFKVATQDFSTSFEHLSVAHSEGAQSDSTIIDELSFEIVYKNRLLPYIYHKQYSSADLMINMPNAVH
jgi:hypothetical protein